MATKKKTMVRDTRFDETYYEMEVLVAMNVMQSHRGEFGRDLDFDDICKHLGARRRSKKEREIESALERLNKQGSVAFGCYGWSVIRPAEENLHVALNALRDVAANESISKDVRKQASEASRIVSRLLIDVVVAKNAPSSSDEVH